MTMMMPHIPDGLGRAAQHSPIFANHASAGIPTANGSEQMTSAGRFQRAARIGPQKQIVFTIPQ
jgi:hypothetical protein